MDFKYFYTSGIVANGCCLGIYGNPLSGTNSPLYDLNIECLCSRCSLKITRTNNVTKHRK